VSSKISITFLFHPHPPPCRSAELQVGTPTLLALPYVLT